MSSTIKSGTPTQTLGVGTKKPHAKKNGSGPPPLTYHSEPSDDVNMNEILEENIELDVILPDGNTKQVTVDSNIPMLDLQIHLAAKSRLSPSGYTLLVFSEETGKPVEYKANQTIGSLGGRTVEIVSKKADSDKTKKTAKELPRGSKPFEMTQRFTINLPRNQKMVLRISPLTTLEQLYMKVCQEKDLDPRRYSFQHPANPRAVLDMNASIKDLRSNEINLITAGMVDAARSLPDLSHSESLTLPPDSFPSYMPGAGETKKKRGFLSFLTKKEKKFKLHDVKYDMDTGSTASNQFVAAQKRKSTTPPAERRNSDAASNQARPKSMFVSSKDMEIPAEKEFRKDFTKENAPPPKAPPRGGKKRPAPLPPQQKKAASGTVEISVNDKKIERNNVQVQDKKSKSSKENGLHNTCASSETVVKGDFVTQRLHSRNSSDSSGYHELTLSGAESPEASRVSATFKTSIDTTSIESADNANGDSGINDVSPMHSSPIGQNMVPGESRTLPLNRTVNKPLRRSHSLERKDKANKPPPPSTKKKRAPAPPPPGGPQVTPLRGTAKTTPPSQAMKPPQETLTSVQKNVSKPTAISDTSLKERHLLKPPNKEKDNGPSEEDIDGQMMMIEDDSIRSEDLESIEQPKSQRPCSFVAPPPPSEPPPPGTPPADYSPVVSQNETKKVDISTEVNDNASLGASSPKNSPISGATGYRSEMAMFVERMSRLTEKVDKDDTNMSDNTSISLADTESISETGSVIRHDTEVLEGIRHTKMDSYTGSESSSVAKYSSEERSCGGSLEGSGLSDTLEAGHQRQGSDNNSIEDSGFREPNGQSRSADNEVSEITFNMPMETVPPPPEFQNEPLQNSQETKVEEEEEEEEEIIEIFEEIVYPLAPSSSYTFGGAYRIPDLETPKEHFSVPDSPRSRNSEGVLSYSSFDIEPSVPELEKQPAPVVDEPPRQKEEFVLTLEDLSNIHYIDDRKRRVGRVGKPPPVQYEIDSYSTNTGHGHVTQVYQSPSQAFVTVQPYTEKETRDDEDSDNIVRNGGSVRGVKGGVRSRCTELSFPPNSEGEVDNVLEEKPISLIALPATRTSTQKYSAEQTSDSDGAAKSDVYKSSATIVIGSQKPTYDSAKDRQSNKDELVQAKKVYINETDDSELSKGDKSGTDVSSDQNSDDNDDMKRQQVMLQAQYEQLQLQFGQWQQQLLENQKLLTNEHIVPEGQNVSLMQMQMQMQQQMMVQLQQSMQAISLQQQKNSNASAEVAAATAAPAPFVTSTPIAAPPPPAPYVTNTPLAPPPPPVAKEEVTVVKAQPKTRPKPDPKRFERKLDPREELMIAIRNFKGRDGLKAVPVAETHWHQ